MGAQKTISQTHHLRLGARIGARRHRDDARLDQRLALLAADLARLEAGLGLRRPLDAQLDEVARRLDDGDALDDVGRRRGQAARDAGHAAGTRGRHGDHLAAEDRPLLLAQRGYDLLHLQLQVRVVEVQGAVVLDGSTNEERAILFVENRAVSGTIQLHQKILFSPIKIITYSLFLKLFTNYYSQIIPYS